MTKLILASSSPRRKELLSYLEIPFICLPADVDETVFNGEAPEQVVARLSRMKAEVIAKQNPSDFIIGSDTIVAIENLDNEFEILGKPIDKRDALRMLKLLQGETHFVYTGLTLLCLEKNYLFDKVVVSKVKFINLVEEEIIAYIETGEPMDKAGAYALQGIGCRFIESIEGSYSSVVGLPLSEVYQELRKHVKK